MSAVSKATTINDQLIKPRTLCVCSERCRQWCELRAGHNRRQTGCLFLIDTILKMEKISNSWTRSETSSACLLLRDVSIVDTIINNQSINQSICLSIEIQCRHWTRSTPRKNTISTNNRCPESKELVKQYDINIKIYSQSKNILIRHFDTAIKLYVYIAIKRRHD